MTESCRELRQWLDSVPPEPVERLPGALRAHAESCAECGQQVAAAQALTAGLGPLPAPRLSAEFETRLRQRLAAEKAPARERMRRVMRWYWGLGALVGGAALVHGLVAAAPSLAGAQVFVALALLIAAGELLPGPSAVSLVELVRRTMR